MVDFVTDYPESAFSDGGEQQQDSEGADGSESGEGTEPGPAGVGLGHTPSRTS